MFQLLQNNRGRHLSNNNSPLPTTAIIGYCLVIVEHLGSHIYNSRVAEEDGAVPPPPPKTVKVVHYTRQNKESKITSIAWRWCRLVIWRDIVSLFLFAAVHSAILCTTYFDSPHIHLPSFCFSTRFNSYCQNTNTKYQWIHQYVAC